jgi:hypothetical protein
VMKSGFAKLFYHSGQGCIGSGVHIHWFGGQSNMINLNHGLSAQSQGMACSKCEIGQ